MKKVRALLALGLLVLVPTSANAQIDIIARGLAVQAKNTANAPKLLLLPQLTTTDRGGVFGTASTQLMPANSGRNFIQVQNQSQSANCYISGLSSATADYHSMLIGPGQLFESQTHVSTGAINIICSAANTSVYAREG